MAYEPLKPEELKKLVLMGKKRSLNMAYNPGPKEADLMIIDRIKAPDVLGRVAKKEGAGTKVVIGTFEVEQRVLRVNATQTVAGAAKKLRKFLKTLDFSYKVEILDPSGNLLEDADENTQTEDQKTAPSGPRVAPETDQQTQEIPAPETLSSEGDETQVAALTERLRALQAPLAEMGADATALKKGVAMVVPLIKARKLDKAEEYLAKIETAVDNARVGETAKTTGEQGSEPTQKQPERKALVARATSLKTVLESSASTDVAAVRGPLVEALIKLRANDLAGAEADITAAENALNALPADDKNDQTAPSPEQQSWEEGLASLQADVDAAMAAKTGDLDAINRSFNYAVSQAQAGAFGSALAAAATTRDQIEQARQETQNARVAQAEAAKPDNAVKYAKSRLNWINTRNALHADLIKLKMVIDAKTQGVPGLEEISQNTGVLIDYIEELDSTLEDTLNALTETGDGPDRERLKDEGIKIINDYRATLAGDFFTHVDNNGFTNTNIRDTALSALQGVETALAA